MIDHAWLPEHDAELRTYFLDGMTIKVISERLSKPRSAAGVRARLEKLGMKREKPRPPNWTKPAGNLQDVRPPMVIKESKPPFDTLDISILELTEKTCRTLTGHHVYCGHEVHLKSCCKWHYERHYARSIKGDYNAA